MLTIKNPHLGELTVTFAHNYATDEIEYIISFYLCGRKMEIERSCVPYFFASNLKEIINAKVFEQLEL